MKRMIKFSLFAITQPVFAEVSDKIPSVIDMWLLSLVAALIVFFVSLRFRYFSFLGVILSVTLASATYDMHTDRYLFSAIVQEQGSSYIFQAYFSSFVLGFSSIIAFIVSTKFKVRRST